MIPKEDNSIFNAYTVTMTTDTYRGQLHCQYIHSYHDNYYLQRITPLSFNAYTVTMTTDTYRGPLQWCPEWTGDVFVTGSSVLWFLTNCLGTFVLCNEHRLSPGISSDTGDPLYLVTNITGGGTGTPIPKLPLTERDHHLTGHYSHS